MSASSLSLPFLVPKPSKDSKRQSSSAANERPAPARMIRRRPDIVQGRALEILGHAIEYLIDSRMFMVNEPHTHADTEAVQMLSRCSREIFSTCAEVVPLTERLKQWAFSRLKHSLAVPSVHPLPRKP